MSIVISERAMKALQEVSPIVRKTFHKQLAFLEQNFRHPSLHAKKYDETSDLWQARVNGGWRFYFLIQHNVYLITDIVSHPK
jgi:mRNA-degrading endonuclease RelE of RelBE toxin-antitoxin system